MAALREGGGKLGRRGWWEGGALRTRRRLTARRCPHLGFLFFLLLNQSMLQTQGGEERLGRAESGGSSERQALLRRRRRRGALGAA